MQHLQETLVGIWVSGKVDITDSFVTGFALMRTLKINKKDYSDSEKEVEKKKFSKINK